MSDNFCIDVVSVPCFRCNPIKSTCFFSSCINKSLRQLGILLKPYIEQILFMTVPDSSINSWLSWFIFNLRKINICNVTVMPLYMHRDDNCRL
jgi:hypothetical protein